MIILKRLIYLAQTIQQLASQRVSASRLSAIAVIVGISLMGLNLPAQAADIDYSKNSKGAIQSTERYDNIRSKSGGMNGFDAADPRRNIDEASAKAQELSDVARRRQLEADDPLETVREAVGSIKDGIGDTADSVGNKVDNATDSVGNRVGNAVNPVGYSENSKGAIQSTERYDAIQSKSGGMNGFDAADPRRNIGEASAKAQELSDVARRRQLEANDPLEPVREAVDSIKTKVGNATDSAAVQADRTVDSVTNKASRTVDSVARDLK